MNLTEEQKQKICDLIEKSLNSVTLREYKTDGDEELLLIDLIFSIIGDINKTKIEIENIVEQIYFDMDDWDI